MRTLTLSISHWFLNSMNEKIKKCYEAQQEVFIKVYKAVQSDQRCSVLFNDHFEQVSAHTGKVDISLSQFYD